MLPPSRYYLVSEFIYILVSLLYRGLSDVHGLSDFSATLLVSRELSHHEECHSGNRLRLTACSDLQVGDGFGDRAGCIINIHGQIQLVCSGVSNLSGVQNDLVLQFWNQIFDLLVAAAEFLVLN